MKFRFIDTDYNDQFMNMAIDEALLISKIPVLRFYRWKPSTISIGYFQSMKNEINIEKCKELGIGYVRRLTGGKAVFHDKELTYSFIIDESLMPKTILESYKQISEGIVNGLVELGINPEMRKEVDKKLQSSNCFHVPSYYELTINNKKFVGSAQKRQNGKILQHGSILIDADYDLMCSLFSQNSENFLEETKKRVTSISNELGKKITYQQLGTFLKSGFSKAFKAEMYESQLTHEESQLAKKLVREKYATDAWNLMK